MKKLDKLRKALNYAHEQKLRSFSWNVANDEIGISCNLRCSEINPVTTKCLIDMLTIMISNLEAEIPFELIDEKKAAPKKKAAVKRSFVEDDEDEDDDEEWPEEPIEEYVEDDNE